MTRKLVPVAELNQVRKLQDLIKPMLEPPAHFDLQWLKRNNWIAVPAESGNHFDDNDAGALAQAMQIVNVGACFAIATEPLENFPVSFEVETTTEGLKAFSEKCGHFNFLLVPRSLSFGILCTTFDYFVVSGALEFVENAVGPISTAQRRFVEYASDSPDSKRLLAVSARYTSLAV
jgi:hypothetical protein